MSGFTRGAWLGYYQKMAAADVFVYLDDVQYRKRAFQNRNRIKTPDGPLWLTVPVATRGLRFQKVRGVKVCPGDWPSRHFEALRHNYARAPYFHEHEDWLRGLYARPWERLMDLNLELDRYFRRCLGIRSALVLESEVGSEGGATAR
ncbi:MAG: hypothetical protein FD126_3810, partial [Elusimicrobia bacterium]